ncbi:MAG: hypothetical protein IPH39_03515 [Sulfuritalea sp.]|jgi:hypothetical protein|nr:hypothetical protein [Sulfuritalea sp.]MBK8760696.1 hypothetical protein [Sulfuritalea sp.]MBP6638259.1 hypothetical protein [Sulfuritalea sp.]
MIPALIFAAGAGFLVLLLWQRYRRLARERYIRQFALPRGLYERLRKRRPELELKDCALVARGLRQFFLAYLNSGCRFVAMPSQAVDDLWHEFILYTRAYEAFCGKAFGGFLHHTPAVVLSPDKRNNEGLRRVWWQCCKEENIDPRSPLRLPLLFAIDAKLGIADGFIYKPDCKALQGSEAGTAHCGADFSDSSIDGGTDGFADGGADGGGDGGGCGGGCGGGGD